MKMAEQALDRLNLLFRLNTVQPGEGKSASSIDACLSYGKSIYFFHI